MIFWEDMRSRMVHWFWFPLLVAGFVVLRYNLGESLSDLTSGSTTSISFIVLQLLLVSFYFSLKAKRWVNVTQSLLGWGDVLMLVSLAFYFTLPALVSFYILSLVVILIGWLIYQRATEHPATLIPLAGLQALLLLLTIVLQWIFPDGMPVSLETWMRGLTG